MTKRIYFDNAATSFPKPECVYQAMDRYARQVGASAGRGAYAEAMESGDIIAETRRLLAELLNAPQPESIIFTFNCTDALSLAIKGYLGRPGGHVITTCMDHNSVLRPLHRLNKELGIEVTYVAANSEGLVDPEDVRRAIRKDTRLIAVVHGSNVCGALQDIVAMGRIAREYQIPYLVDAAQTVGHLPLDVQSFPVDMVAFPGHKGLMGPLGTGALYVRPGFESHLIPLREGGTGSKSEEPIQPDFMPDWLEAGSHNALGLAGLGAALGWLKQKGLEAIRAHGRTLCELFRAGTAGIDGLRVYGPGDPDRLAGAFSVSVDGYRPAELAALLERNYGLLTRPGLHCAPFAHAAIGTLQRGGTVRFSMGPFITDEDIQCAVGALGDIARIRSHSIK